MADKAFGMIHKIPAPCCVFDNDGGIIDCNDEFRAFFGIKNTPPISEIAPGIQPCGRDANAHIFDAIARGDGDFDLYCVAANNETNRVRFSLKRDGDCIIAYVAMQAPCNRLQEYKLQIFATSPIPIILWTLDGSVIDCNEAAYLIHNAPNKQYFLDNIESLAPEFQPCGEFSTLKNQKLCAECIQTGRVSHIFAMLTVDGDMFYVDVTMQLTDLGEYSIIVAYLQDVYALQKSGERVREAEKLGRLMFDVAPVGITLYNNELVPMDCNFEAIRMFGCKSKEDFIYADTFFTPDFQPNGQNSIEMIQDFIREAFKNGESSSEILCVKANGEYMHTHTTWVRIHYQGGFVVAEYCRDRTDQKEALTRERHANEFANTLLDLCPLMVELWDENLKIFAVNKQAATLLGLQNADEYIRFADKYSPTLQPCGTPGMEKFREIIKVAFATGYARSEWMHIDANGVELPVELTIVKILRNNETVYVGYSRDLRPARASQQRIRKANERTDLMLNATPLSCYLMRGIYNEHGKLIDMQAIDCNAATIEFYGFRDKEDALENIWQTFVAYRRDGDAGKGRILERSFRAMNSGYDSYETEHISMNGDHIAVEVVLVRLDFDGEPVLARYAKDLRQVRAMANEMKEIEIAKEENQAKTRFLTRMSHEIRTPLTQIKGIAEIELQRDSHTDQTQESFSRIYNSADLLHTIINDILDLSKVEAGKMELVPVSYELPSLIVDSVQLNLIYIEGKDVNFTVHVDEKLPTRLIGDDLRIKQIINNLLSNAFKYTHSGQVSLTFTMEKSYRFDEIILVISISDTGDGMTAEQLDMLFEVEYSRFNMSRNRAIEGSGLGMNIAHNLIELHGGEIDVHSEPGEGTTFMVRLPQRITGANPIGPEMAKNLQHAQMNARSLRRMSRIHRKPMPYGTVLVVDDVESNLYVARGLLAPYGLKVETAVSGAESVALIRAGRVYDIIFMDHMMPGMDGMLATKIIQETGYSHPIVALTANTVKGQAEIFLANGFDGFLSKPISILELDECLMKFIHAKQTPEVLEAAENAHITIEATSTNRSGLTDFFLKDAERALNILNPIIDDLAAGGRLCDAGMKSYINQTHGMKSALANMGQSWLADMASSLEDAARAGDMEAVISQTPLYLQNLRALMKELGYETARNAAPKADAAIDTESIARLLGDIASSCGEFNKRAAKTALTELQKMTLPDNISQLLTEISNLLLISSFEKAASLINTQLSLM